MDVVDLREFYNSAWGQVVRRILRARLARLWPDVRGQALVALGYATPLLRPWLDQAGALIALMPDTQGVAYWPREGENRAALVNLEQLPLEGDSIDRAVLLHALETAPDPAAVLDEVWRVLKPNGQVVVIVPSRRGLWAQSEATPFGTGRPYSTAQLRTLLREAGFCIEKTGHALFMPPVSSALCRSLAWGLERIAAPLMPALGGVLVVQAGKQVFSPAMVKKAKPQRRRLVLPMPFPSAPVPTSRSNHPVV